MKPISFINTSGLTLRGLLQYGEKNKLIIMCHGFRSNRSSRGRFDRFSQTFNKAGYSVLRFDFGGCGESDDRPLTLAGEVDDLTSAIDYAVHLGFHEIALYGHSLGARVCIEAFDPSCIKTMILTGAGTGPVQYDWSKEFKEEQLLELKSTGNLFQKVDDPFRSEVKITRQMLQDFEVMDQKASLSKITSPTLIIHGDQGEEAILMPMTRNGMKWLPAGSRLEVIPGADHSFFKHLNDVEKLSGQWLRRHF